MPMEWTPVALPFSAGIDTKADPKTVQAPKLSRLENGVFTKKISIRKRNGYTALGDETVAATPVAITTGRALATRDDELLLFDDSKVYSYSEARDGWLDKGAFESVIVGLNAVAKTGTTQTWADRATAGGVTVYCWEDGRATVASTGAVRYSIVDATTGAELVTDRSLGANTCRPRAVVVGSWIHIFHRHTGSNELRTFAIDPTNVPATATASAQTVATDLNTTVPIYDVASHGDRAVYTYRSTTASRLKSGFISQDGTTDGGFTALITVAQPTAVSIAVSPITGYIGVTYCTAAVLETVLYDNAFGLMLDTQMDGSVSAVAATIASCWDPQEASAGVERLRIFVGCHHATTYLSFVESASCLTTGYEAQSTVLLRHVALASRAWSDGTNVYVNVVHDSVLQATHFTLRYDGLIVAKALPGIAAGRPPASMDAQSGRMLPQVESLGSRTYAWAAGAKTRLDVEAAAETGLASGTTPNNAFLELGIRATTLAFHDAQSHRAVQLGHTLYLSGGFLWQYDSQGATEAGFHVIAENITASSANSTGSMTSGASFSYRCYPEWTNGRGELERGSVAAAITITLGASDDTVTLVIPTISLTAKKSPRGAIRWAIYRTEANPTSDSPFYRVSSLDPADSGASLNKYLADDPTADTVSFVDGLADSTGTTPLITRELDYQNSGELEHIAPPAASIVASGENRVYLAGFEESCLIRHSKLRFEGEVVAFNDALTVQVDEEGGPITGLARLNEALIVFKERRVYYLTGDGPDNTGTGAYGSTQILASDVGCSNQRSIVLTPQGLMFQSHKGIYLLTTSLQLQYIGADVEQYNAQTITAATLLADSNQVRFLTDDGMTLLFDTLFGQWSTFTAHEGTDATVWQNVYHYVRADGEVRQETTTDFRDAGQPFKLTLETAWIKPAGLLQGFVRVRSMAVVGTYRSAHLIRASVAYDYESVYTDLEWDATAVMNTATFGSGSPYGADAVYGGSGYEVYQFTARLPRQKCQSIRFKFEDVPGNPPGESYQIVELALEVGAKGGIYPHVGANKIAT